MQKCFRKYFRNEKFQIRKKSLEKFFSFESFEFEEKSFKIYSEMKTVGVEQKSMEKTENEALQRPVYRCFKFGFIKKTK